MCESWHGAVCLDAGYVEHGAAVEAHGKREAARAILVKNEGCHQLIPGGGAVQQAGETLGVLRASVIVHKPDQSRAARECRTDAGREASGTSGVDFEAKMNGMGEIREDARGFRTARIVDHEDLGGADFLIRHRIQAGAQTNGTIMRNDNAYDPIGFHLRSNRTVADIFPLGIEGCENCHGLCNHRELCAFRFKPKQFGGV